MLKASDCSIVLPNSRPAVRYIFPLGVQPYGRTAVQSYCRTHFLFTVLPNAPCPLRMVNNP